MDVDALILKMIEKLIDARRNYRFTTTLGFNYKGTHGAFRNSAFIK